MLTYPIQTCDDSMDITMSIVCLLHIAVEMASSLRREGCLMDGGHQVVLSLQIII